MGYGPIVPMLMVASLMTSFGFYTEILGFSAIWQWSKEARFDKQSKPTFLSLESGEAVLFMSLVEH